MRPQPPRSCSVDEARALGLRAAAKRLGRFVLALLPGLVLAYAVMGLVWPWAVVDPLNPFRSLEYFSVFFEKPWQELFGGALVPVPDMPRSYVPTLFALQMPEVFLVLALAGIVLAGTAVARQGEPQQRAVLLLLIVAAVLPVAVTVADAAGHVQRHPPFHLRRPAAGGARRPCGRARVRVARAPRTPGSRGGRRRPGRAPWHCP